MVLLVVVAGVFFVARWSEAPAPEETETKVAVDYPIYEKPDSIISVSSIPLDIRNLNEKCRFLFKGIEVDDHYDMVDIFYSAKAQSCLYLKYSAAGGLPIVHYLEDFLSDEISIIEPVWGQADLEKFTQIAEEYREIVANPANDFQNLKQRIKSDCAMHEYLLEQKKAFPSLEHFQEAFYSPREETCLYVQRVENLHQIENHIHDEVVIELRRVDNNEIIAATLVMPVANERLEAEFYEQIKKYR